MLNIFEGKKPVAEERLREETTNSDIGKSRLALIKHFVARNGATVKSLTVCINWNTLWPTKKSEGQRF